MNNGNTLASVEYDLSFPRPLSLRGGRKADAAIQRVGWTDFLSTRFKFVGWAFLSWRSVAKTEAHAVLLSFPRRRESSVK